MKEAENENIKKLSIEFFSDFICPWCYIGKSRIERISRKLENEIDLRIDLQPFILYPQIPKGGASKSIFAKKTKPGMGRSLRQEAEKEGIDLAYDLIERIPNSLEAHRLLSIIDDLDIKFQTGLDISRAYFQSGADIEDHSVLSNIALDNGVPKNQIIDFKSGIFNKEIVTRLINKAREEFITVVPSIRINSQITLPGLQSIEVWENYLRRATQRMTRD